MKGDLREKLFGATLAVRHKRATALHRIGGGFAVASSRSLCIGSLECSEGGPLPPPKKWLDPEKFFSAHVHLGPEVSTDFDTVAPTRYQTLSDLCLLLKSLSLSIVWH